MTRQEKHGWLIVAALFVTMIAIAGGGYNATPVFVPALLKTFGWSRAKVSLLPSVTALAWGVLVFPVGWLLDRVEARFVMVTGALAAGLGFFLASRAASFVPIFIAFVMLGVGIAAGTVAPGAFVVANWFRAHRGLAMGVMLGGTTTGGMLMTLAGELPDQSLGMAHRLSRLRRARLPHRVNTYHAFAQRFTRARGEYGLKMVGTLKALGLDGM